MREQPYTPSSDTSQICIVTRYELYKHMRSKGILAVIALFILVIVLQTALLPLLGIDYPDDPSEFVQGYVSWVTLLILFAAAAFSTKEIASEFDKRTGYLMFPNPLKREVFLVGKFIASMFIIIVCLVGFYLVVAVLSLIITDGMPMLMFNSLGFALLYAFALASLGYMLSAIMKTSTTALILHVVLILIVFSMIQGILMVANFDPWFLINQCGDTISYIMSDPYPVSQPMPMGPGASMTMFIPDPAISAAIMFIYGTVSTALAAVLFRRRELST